MKTVSTAVEELRDTVNEKIGEEKTAREEVMILIMVVVMFIMTRVMMVFIVTALLEKIVTGNVKLEERPGEVGEEKQGAERENQGEAWSNPGTRR